MALFAAAWFAYWMRITGDSYFFVDDWLLIEQAGSLGGMVEQYNGHLSVVILAIYRGLVEVFGFDYTAFRLVATSILAGTAVAYFATTRRYLGPPLAGLLTMSLLWYAGMELYPAEMNHHLVMLGAIACSAALNRGPRADGILAVALVLSLASAGGGVAVLAACLVHNALTRPHARRWLIVVIPGALWAIWVFFVAGGVGDLGPRALDTSGKVELVKDLLYSPFDHLGLRVPVLAWALIAAFLALAVVLLRRGLDAIANLAAWSAGMVTWAVGLAQGRGAFANDQPFRYTYLLLGFALLAIVPRRPIRWPERFQLGTDRRLLSIGAVAILVVGGVAALAVRDDMQEFAQRHARSGWVDRGAVLAIGLEPSVVPDDATLPFTWNILRARDARALFERYGQPFAATHDTADQRLLDIGATRAQPNGTRDVPRCPALTQPLEFVPGMVPLFLWSRDRSFTVDVRRYGEDWVRVTEAPAGRAVALTLPGLFSTVPWEVRADGACRVGAG